MDSWPLIIRVYVDDFAALYTLSRCCKTFRSLCGEKIRLLPDEDIVRSICDTFTLKRWKVGDEEATVHSTLCGDHVIAYHHGLVCWIGVDEDIYRIEPKRSIRNMVRDRFFFRFRLYPAE